MNIQNLTRFLLIVLLTATTTFLAGCNQEESVSENSESDTLTGTGYEDKPENSDDEVWTPGKSDLPAIPLTPVEDEGHILSNEQETLRQAGQINDLLQDNEARKKEQLENLESEY